MNSKAQTTQNVIDDRIIIERRETIGIVDVEYGSGQHPIAAALDLINGYLKERADDGEPTRVEFTYQKIRHVVTLDIKGVIDD